MASMTVLTVALELAFVASLTTLPPKTSTKNEVRVTSPVKNAQHYSMEVTKSSSVLQHLVSSVPYHAKTLLLFTYSDLKTVLLPWALFGIAHALSAPLFGLSSQPTLLILARFPLALFWVAANLLPFCIGNQRNPTAIMEDSINKAWRPLPSKRLTQDEARNVMLAGYVFALYTSSWIGGAKQCVALAILGFLYNDMGGGDNSFLARNALNGLGFISFGSGAMEVALGRNVVMTPQLVNWLTLIALVVTTGVTAADMYDQVGDKAVGRSTLPLIIGDEAARWTIVISTLAWSLVCPQFWGIGLTGSLIVLASGAYVALRCLKKREVEQDKKTFKVWNLWLVAVYCLPLMKVLGL